MLRDHEQGQAIEDDEQRQREKEREEAEWQKYLEEQSELESIPITERICASSGPLGEECILPEGHKGMHESAMKTKWKF